MMSTSVKPSSPYTVRRQRAQFPILVTNVCGKVSRAQVFQVFEEKFGDVKEVILPLNADRTHHVGVCYIEFKTSSAHQDAIREMSIKLFNETAQIKPVSEIPKEMYLASCALKDPKKPNNEVQIDNVSTDATVRDVLNILKKHFGPLKENTIGILYDYKTKRILTDQIFVEFKQTDDATKAVTSTDPVVLKDKTLRFSHVLFYKPRFRKEFERRIQTHNTGKQGESTSTNIQQIQVIQTNPTSSTASTASTASAASTTSTASKPSTCDKQCEKQLTPTTTKDLTAVNTSSKDIPKPVPSQQKVSVAPPPPSPADNHKPKEDSGPSQPQLSSPPAAASNALLTLIVAKGDDAGSLSPEEIAEVDLAVCEHIDRFGDDAVDLGWTPEVKFNWWVIFCKDWDSYVWMKTVINALQPLSNGTKVRAFGQEDMPSYQKYYVMVTGGLVKKPELFVQLLARRLDVTSTSLKLYGQGSVMSTPSGEEGTLVSIGLDDTAVTSLERLAPSGEPVQVGTRWFVLQQKKDITVTSQSDQHGQQHGRKRGEPDTTDDDDLFEYYRQKKQKSSL